MTSALQYPWQHEFVIQHTQRLLRSFQHWTGRSLLAPAATPAATAQALFQAPFVVVSHGTQTNPIFNYGNQTALDLWEFDWSTFTQMPSRYSAEPDERRDRAQLLAAAKTQGYSRNYQGIRISRTGKRFRVVNVTLWEVLDETNHSCGQAATFDQWEFL